MNLDFSELGPVISRRKHGQELLYKCVKCGWDKLEVNTSKGFFHCFHCKIKGRTPNADLQAKKTKNPPRAKELIIPGKLPFDWGRNPPIGSYLGRRRIDNQRAKEIGICLSSERLYRDRIIIPIKENGVTVAFTARAYRDGMKPKEISSPSSETSNRSWFFYPDVFSVREGENVLIVEGVFDCEAALRNKIKCLATLGSSISDIQIGKLLSRKPKRIMFMYDGDEAGKKGALAALKKILPRTNAEVMIASIQGRDPDELNQEEWEVVYRFLRNPAGKLRLEL